MKKGVVVLAAVAIVASAGYLAVRGLRTRQAPAIGPAARLVSPEGAVPSGSPPPPPASSASAPSVGVSTQADAINVAAPELGGHIELVTSEYDREDRAAIHLIDRGRPDESSWMATAAAPQEIVIGFFSRQPALIAAIVINPNTHTAARWAKEVEAWTSMDGPNGAFAKVASLTLSHDDAEQTMTFAPVEARFVKVRIVSQYNGDTEVGMGKIRVIEGQAPGYTPLLARNPSLGGLVANRAADAPPAAGPPPAALPAAIEASPVAANACRADPPVVEPPLHTASAKVLVLARKDRSYPPLGYAATDAGENPASSIYGRTVFTRVAPGAATPMLLQSDQGFDTVVLSQVCDVKTSVPESFKRALVDWVGQGHKLIIHDSDLCDGADTPDYSFLPYRFSTSNPGKRGAESEKLLFVEESTLASSNPKSPAFLDVDAWTRDHNELGDSNTVKEYDPHWCGALVTRNVLKVNGFVETYTHYGRGLIIYDGFDYDQASNAAYHRLVTRELAQPFNPDGLACGARLSDFVLTTDEALKAQEMSPGRTYQYPLTVLSNQGYKGAVQLTAATVPPDPTVSVALDRSAIDLVDISDVRLTVTTSGASTGADRTIAVRGTDTSGHSNVLCLSLNERTTGALRVTTAFPHPVHPTKNLEIILDLSGSMKLPLGTSTRIATARRVLRDVLAKLPDDVNVGLRVYGHRYGSRQKETCTDSELIVPIQKLDRDRLLKVVDSTQPRGETPLVYSVLQTAADLKAAGGGSVILITDGEESCHGDPVAAARELKASGVSLALQILGFTLSGKQVEQQLTQFAEATGGRYYHAQDGESLGRALLMAAADKMPFTVFDSSGRQVAKGETDSAALDLTPGEYKVVLRAADQTLAAERVAITPRGLTTLTVIVTNDRFELQR